MSLRDWVVNARDSDKASPIAESAKAGIFALSVPDEPPDKLFIAPPPSSRFQWQPLDQDVIAEAIEERVSIMMESGIAEAQARQEATWELERNRCRERFYGHAQIMLDAPAQDRGAVLQEYRQAAARVFGQEVAEQMVATMAAWVRTTI